MAYTVRHRKSDGSTEVTRVHGDGSSTTVERGVDGACTGVIIKEGKGKKKVAYNFNKLLGGGNLSKADREAALRGHLKRLRSQYKGTGGMSGDGTRKHLASIPPEIWYSEIAENGPDSVRDPKNVKRLIEKFGLQVSGRRRR